MNEYKQTIRCLEEFNNYFSACICPPIYARNKKLTPFPMYSHNHGGIMTIVENLMFNENEFNKWHFFNLAKNYLYAFVEFKNKNLDLLIKETLANEPNMEPTENEKKLVSCIFNGGEIQNEIIQKTILPVLDKMFRYRFENLWGRHYMEQPHKKNIRKYPYIFIPPTAKGDVQIKQKTDLSFWSIEIDTFPFTWSMVTIPFNNPIGYIPLKKLDGQFIAPKIHKREHLVVRCEDIPIEEWFFTYNENLNNYDIETFYSSGILPTSLAMQIFEITGKMISMIAAMKKFRIKNNELKFI